MKRIGTLLLVVSLLALNTAALAEERLWTELPAEARSGEVTGAVDMGAFAALAERLSPTVVFVEAELAQNSRNLRGLLQPGLPPATGGGAGFIIHKEGYILTNNHVVERAVKLTVKTLDDRTFEARLVGADPLTDLALLKIDSPEPLPVAPLGDSDSLRIGEWVIAIGNPLGLDHTVTAGIISAMGRKEVFPNNRDLYADFIQTDASINPGNSGGPLINMRGEVIGINTAIYRSAQGIGFAIPVNMAKTLIPRLAAGHVARAYLGVYIQDVTRQLADSLNLPSATGALVAQVQSQSPADKAGLVAGDVILSFAGKEVEDSKDLRWLAATSAVGKRLPVTILREGKRKKLSVVLAPHPEDSPPQTGGGTPESEDDVAIEAIGLRVGPVPEKLARQLHLPRKVGVVITGLARGSAAALAGLRPGDVILRFGYATVKSPNSLAHMVDSLKSGMPMSLLIQRGASSLWVGFRKP